MGVDDFLAYFAIGAIFTGMIFLFVITVGVVILYITDFVLPDIMKLIHGRR